MDKSVLYTIIITFGIIVLLCGILLFCFAGSLNFFGTQGFHGEPGYFIEGVVLGAIFVAPAVTTVVLLIRRYKRYALIWAIITVLLWIIFALIIPFIVTKREEAMDKAPARDIAARAIARTDKDRDISDSGKYATTVGNRLWIYEGTATRLDVSKEKEVVECAAEMIVNNKALDPPFTGYEWRTVYNDKDVYRYVMILLYEDGSFVEIYDIELKRWKELQLPDPPRL